MNDGVFRWVMVAGFVAVVAVTAPHRVRAGTKEKLDRRKEGAFMLATLRPAGGALWLSIIAYMINPAWMAWSAVSLPMGVRWGGVGLMVCTGLLVVWTFSNLGGNLTDTVVTRKEHTLITSGPYQYVRHPFYVAFAVGLLGVSLGGSIMSVVAGICALISPRWSR